MSVYYFNTLLEEFIYSCFLCSRPNKFLVGVNATGLEKTLLLTRFPYMVYIYTQHLLARVDLLVFAHGGPNLAIYQMHKFYTSRNHQA